ncbi:MAG TPA: NADH dehydrogenase subunit, partial [Oceanospirillales bacterium]|nr:NADH dehydrogenase subunit [Oceanospirillales bacterium]
MNLLDQLFIVVALALASIAFLRNRRINDKVSPLWYAAMLIMLIRMAALAYGGDSLQSAFTLDLLGFKMRWQFSALSWFFAVITVVAALASAVFMSGDWGRQYRQQGGNYGLLQLALIINVASMILLLASGDLLSLFIGWEFVSWASFLMMVLQPSKLAKKAAVKYIVYAMAGAMALMVAIVMIYSVNDSLEFEQITLVFAQMSSTSQIALVSLLFIAFAIKMGLLPFHLWQAIAYAETPGPGAAFLGAISSRMGMFAIILVVIQFIGLSGLRNMGNSFINMQTLLAWVAALTTIIPTYIALQQHDAKRLLAWHGVGQGGYMLLGIIMFDSLGSAGGLMHVLNHASYQAALFMTVVAVVYRTGTSDLNKLGGLVTQMPLSFLVMLIGIIGLAGLPPMNGFVSKWLVYRSLLLNGQPLLFVAAVLGTLGTILSVYKLIHNTFLGQLRMEHREVREVPWSMMAPMLGLSVIVFITGFMPGLILPWIAAIQESIGIPVVLHHLGGVAYGQGGLDMIWVSLILFYGFGVGALIFYFLGGKAKRIHQYDNYAGGH